MAPKLKIRFWFTELTVAALVAIFLYTAITKLKDASAFEKAMNHNSLLKAYSSTLTWLIPATEILIAFLLIIPVTRRRGLLASAIILGCFTGYIAYMLLYSPHLPCTCGGIIQSMTWSQHLLFNILFTTISLISFFIYRRPKTSGRRSRTPVNIVSNHF